MVVKLYICQSTFYLYILYIKTTRESPHLLAAVVASVYRTKHNQAYQTSKLNQNEFLYCFIVSS